MVAQQRFRSADFVTDKAIKVSVLLVTTANVVSLVGAQTIETVVLAIGDRVLLNAQTDPKDNGIWVVQQAAWNRASDWDGNRDATNGTLVISTQGGSVLLWELQTTDEPFEPGTHDANFIISAPMVDDEGSFTVNWLGFDAPVATTIYYRRVGNQVTLFGSGLVTGTSDEVFKNSDFDVPVSLRPIANSGLAFGLASDNGGAWMTNAFSLLSTGRFLVTAEGYSGPWTASGTAFFEFVHMTYLINLP